MASILSITDELLKRTISRTLPQFITEHMENGGDLTSMHLALFMATGQAYDKRTVKNWIERYGP